MNPNQPISIDVNDLNGTNGLTIIGIDREDFSGASVSNAGDINGDGIDDIIIGAPGVGLSESYDGTLTFYNYIRAGASYVIFGSDNFTDAIDLSALDGSKGFTIEAENPGDGLGTSVSNAGDINGDGIDDIIIGAPDTDPEGKPSAGSSYIVFGNTDIGTSGTLEVAELNGDNGFAIDGTQGGGFVRVGIASLAFIRGSALGNSVSNAGDVNGDGIDDLIVSSKDKDAFFPRITSSGESYIIFGSTSGFDASLSLSELDGNNGFKVDGIDVYDNLGSSLSSAGDINGDGIDDLVIGASGADPNDVRSAGESYVIFGDRNLGNDGILELLELNGSNGFTINGIAPYDVSGFSVSNAGDVNGDGIDDLLIGASRANLNNRDSAGESYVVFGSSNGFRPTLELSELNGSNGFAIDGIEPNNRFGFSVSNAGDVNRDGFDDLIIGAPGANANNRDSAGEAYVIFGSADVGITGSVQLDRVNSLIINGVNEYDSLGRSVSNAGDLNGDGFDDLIIGAPGAQFIDRNFPGSEPTGAIGKSYVIFGSGQFASDEIEGTVGNDTLFGTVGDDTIFGLAGNDRLVGLAGNDSIRGDVGSDELLGNNGDDTLEGGNGNDTVRGGADNDLVRGNSGFDLLEGNNGNDVLAGGAGNDLLRGGQGGDRLDGGIGNDTLIGSAGNDSFVLKIGGGNDSILDYFDGSDRFILSQGLEFSDLKIIQNFSSTQIKVSESDEILATLSSVTANFLSEDDFVVEN